MVSFIGDMWKCAIGFKCHMENDSGFETIKVIQRYVDNKYCYVVTRDYNINNNITTFDAQTLLDMYKTCDDAKTFFNVDCVFFISSYNTGVIIS